MATVSMLLIILGAGGLLLGLLWSLQTGLRRANIEPAIVGAVLLGVGLVLPVGNSVSNPLTAIENPSREADIALERNDQHTITARLQVACHTNSEGSATCWGGSVPAPEDAIHKIALGREHGCALMRSGSIQCWGETQLQDSTRSDSQFVDIAATLETVCGITQQGALHCAGADLGMPPPGMRWAQLSGGAHHMCALTANGSAACWGDNSEGQLDVVPNQPLRSISAGHFHTCGLTMTGQAVCWGRNAESQSEPPESTGLTHISAGWSHTCALDTTGQAICWGCGGRQAELMGGEGSACHPPSTSMVSIAAGDLWRSCGVTQSGEATCWGGLSRIGGPI